MIEDVWSSGESGAFNLAFWAEDRLFLDDEIKGILEVVDGELDKASRNTPDGGLVEFWTKHPQKSEYIFGTSEENLYLIRNDQIEPIEIEKLSLEDFEIVDGIWLNEDLLAVSTLNGGCLFIDPYAKQLTQIVNYHSGLPDNEVFAIARDLDNGLWIAHEFGFSRVAPSLPMRSFAHYPGLEGNLLEVSRFDDKIYVATSLGVFYLDEVRNYRDIVYYVQKDRSRTTSPKVEPQPEVATEEPQSGSEPEAVSSRKKKKKKKQKKGLFGSRKKARKSKGEDQPEESPIGTEQEAEPEKKSGFLGGLFRGKKKAADEEEAPGERSVVWRSLAHDNDPSITDPSCAAGSPPSSRDRDRPRRLPWSGCPP